MGNLQSAPASAENSELSGDEQNVDMLDLLLLIVKERRLVLIAVLVAFLIAGLVAFLLPPTYSGSAAILPPQQQQSTSAAMLGQLGSLAGLGGGTGASLFKNTGELYVGILGSQTIANRMISNFHLESVYKRKTLFDTRAALKRETTFEAAKNGLIFITVTDHDPKRASDLANGYVDELYRLNSTLTITEAAQRRVFFDQELADEKTALAKAEIDLKSTQQKTGLIQLSGQAEMIIRSIGDLRAQIASREVQLQSMKTFATDQNPDIERGEQEITSLRAQLAALQNNEKAQQPGDISVPSGRVPEATLEYARNLRELRYHEALYDLLLKQYEAARIDEAKSAPLIQVIDRATPPDKRSGPHRILIALGGALAGLVGSCAWVLVRQGFTRMREVPRNALRLQAIRESFRQRA